MLDSCGISGTGETPQARPSAPRRLTARPAESEHPGAEINQLITTISPKKPYQNPSLEMRHKKSIRGLHL
ncbi:hypothetical protein AB986_11905 [Alkalihalobacillus macyae]|uniref:Uncharacterized protein n=1 Tax=Guptibacillus hwajinpoensis TaxID=208199 RepID=A0A0J6CU08_9BACL|nr:hypothetical protein AB986_11905 [Alkalihalobacillus macyae]